MACPWKVVNKVREEWKYPQTGLFSVNGRFSCLEGFPGKKMLLNTPEPRKFIDPQNYLSAFNQHRHCNQGLHYLKIKIYIKKNQRT